MTSNGNDQSGLIMIGACVSSCFNLSKAWMHSSKKLNKKSACPRKLRMTLTFVGYGNLDISLIFALSTSIPEPETLWPRTIPSFTMKWHFSQFNTRLVSSHLFSIFSRFLRQWSKELPKTEKSSMNTSMLSSISSWKMVFIQRWKVTGALHSPNGIRLYAKVPYGQVNVVLS
ncbi:hypothetical protein Tco_0979854 [Tanacetum coccineum]